MKRLLLAFATALATWACDTVPYNEAYEKRTIPVDTGETVAPTNVFIEDFTGHTCGNCPLAAKEAKRLEGLYGKRVVIMGVHCSYFAKPKASGTAFREDFRTAAGTALDDKFQVSSAGLPKGIISRRRFGNSSVDVLNSDAWEAKVAQIIAEPPVGIKIEMTPNYNAGTGLLSVGSVTTFQKAYEGQLKMAVYLTEDSLVNWQKFYGNTPEDIPNYVHMHVLRTDLLPSGGTDYLSTESSFEVGRLFNNAWTTQVDPKIKVKNCHVIMVLYRADTDEVVQVEEAKVNIN